MNKEEFINGIQSLTEESSWDDIKQYLFYDMKQLAKLKRVEDLSEMQKDILRETKVSLEALKYKTVTTDIEYIKNWLRYRISTRLNLYTTKFDCDTTDIVKETQKRLLEYQGQNVEINSKSDREFIINKNIYLETDTMNSFATTFNQFMRIILKQDKIDPEYVNNYIEKYNFRKLVKKYNIKPGREETNFACIFRDIYYLENIEIWQHQIIEKHKDIWESFLLFSKLSHVSGNFILVPSGYNSERGNDKRIKDYWDLTLCDLENKKIEDIYNTNDKLYESYKWYTENYISLFHLDMCFDENGIKLLFPEHSFEHQLPYIKEMKQCVDSINKLIILRELEMLKTLNPRLEMNTSINEIKDSLLTEGQQLKR